VPAKPFREALMSRYRRLKIEGGAFFYALALAEPFPLGLTSIKRVFFICESLEDRLFSEREPSMHSRPRESPCSLSSA
jgi:hypothetical protein